MHEGADDKRQRAAELMQQSLHRLQAEQRDWQRRSDQLDSQPATDSTRRQQQLLDLEYRQLEQRRQRLGECREYAG